MTSTEPNQASSRKGQSRARYYRQTVVDVPFTAGMTFIGEQSILERMRWEISEDRLTAYRSYERVQDSEAPSNLPGTAYQGAPIAAFPIIAHFDVQRVYNEATGEQSNVIVENTTDRPGMTESTFASIGREICLPISISWPAAKRPRHYRSISELRGHRSQEPRCARLRR